ncbi:MAG: hypothetical protein ACREPZ_13560 [Rhodanobacteraceae bacterium]
MLPGSRLSEIHQLGATFIDAARRVEAEIPNLRIVVPAANDRCRRDIETILKSAGPGTRDQGPEAGSDTMPGPRSPVPGPVLLLDGHAHEALVAADVVLVASGTAALEAMLAKRPMVVAYRISPFTHAIVKGLGMLKTDNYSLPNILAGRTLVPELMQSNCTPDTLAAAIADWFRSAGQRDALIGEFERLHLALRAEHGAATTAARVIGQMIASGETPQG